LKTLLFEIGREKEGKMGREGERERKREGKTF